MNREQAERYAQQWIANWCKRDIDAIVAHHAEDARFTSPLALQRTGNAVVQGRAALRAYWEGARAYDSFSFTLEDAIWDEQQQVLVITYRRDIEGRHSRACEIVRFNEHAQVIEGEGMYGAVWP